MPPYAAAAIANDFSSNQTGQGFTQLHCTSPSAALSRVLRRLTCVIPRLLTRSPAEAESWLLAQATMVASNGLEVSR